MIMVMIMLMNDHTGNQNDNHNRKHTQKQDYYDDGCGHDCDYKLLTHPHHHNHEQ